jgi:NitT/TauT family transport system ATP-binding protein
MNPDFSGIASPNDVQADHGGPPPAFAPRDNSQRPALSIRHVTKRFQSTAETDETLALEDVSLDVRQGEFLSVIGPSGCGKSTLFNIIGGMLTGFEGEVKIGDQLVKGSHPDIGMVFQEESTFPWRTALQNVEFPMEIRNVPQKERRERARHFLSMVGLAEFENHRPSQLSGGMKARTAIARTLAAQPKILLMDEPFGALDEQTRMLLGDQIIKIWKDLQQTTLLITHNITEAVQLSDRVAVMSYRPGRIKRIIDIDLPRPRTSEMISDERFGRLVGNIWQDLREEAMRGLKEAESRRNTT